MPQKGAVEGETEVSQETESVTPETTQEAVEEPTEATTEETVEEPQPEVQEEAPQEKTTTQTIKEAFESGDENSIMEANTKYKNLKTEADAIVARLRENEGVELTAEEGAKVEEFVEARKQYKASVAAYQANQQRAAEAADNLAKAGKDDNIDDAKNQTLGSIDLGNGQVSCAQAKAILDNKNIELTRPEREKLYNHMMVENAKNLEGVGKDIVEGGKGFIGINQRLASVGSALANDNIQAAEKELEGLNTFLVGHLKKQKTGIHNGKPMTDSLKAQVGNEVRLMRAAATKIKDDIKAAKEGISNDQILRDAIAKAPKLPAPAPVEQPASQPTVDAAPVAETAPAQTTEQIIAQSQATNAQADQGITALNETVSQAEQEAAQLTQEIQQQEDEQTEQELGVKPAEAIKSMTEAFDAMENVDDGRQVARAVMQDLNNANLDGLSYADAIKSMEQNYSKEVMDVAKSAINNMFPKTQNNTATRMTRQEDPARKIPIAAENETKKDHLRRINWVKAFFNPRVDAGNALQKVKDLFESPLQLAFSKHLGRELSAEENHLANVMQNAHGHFKKSWDKIYDTNEEQRAYKYQDPTLYLADMINEDKNIRDAFFTGIFDWLGTRAGDTMFNTAEKINAIGGNSNDDSTPPKEAYDLLGRAGIGRTTLIEALGKDVMKQLHITPTKDAPHWLGSKMEMSAGALALDLLQDMGMLAPAKEIKPSEIALAFGKEPPAVRTHKGKEVAESTRTFYRIKTELDENGREVPFGPARRVSEAMRAAGQGVNTKDRMMTQLFGQSEEVKEPSFEQLKGVSRQVKNSNQQITKKEAAGIAKHQNQKNTVRRDAYTMFNALGAEAKRAILGYTDPKNLHKEMRERQESINQSIDREIEQLDDFMALSEANEDAPYYFRHEKWKTGRYGMVSSTFNPQAKKGQRAFHAMDSWKATLDPKAANPVFWQAMKEFLGSNKPDELRTKYGDALTAMVEYEQSGTFTPKGIQDIVDSKVNAEGFTALHAIAKHDMALAQGTTFETDLAIEIDGKTNGVILTLLQYGAAASPDELAKILRKGGFYTMDDPAQSYFDFDEAGGQDAYKEVMGPWQAALANSQMKPEKLKAIRYLFGMDKLVKNDDGSLGYEQDKKHERNLTKPSLMVSNYLAGDEKVADALAKEFMTNIYKLLGNIEGAREYNVAQRAINQLVPGAVPKVALDPKEVDIKDKDVKKLKEIILNDIAPPLVDEIAEQYRLTKEGQVAVNDTLDVMYRMHSAVRARLIDQKVKELADKGVIEPSINDLTKEQIKSIDNRVALLRPQARSNFNTNPRNFEANMDLSNSEAKTAGGEDRAAPNRRVQPKRKGMSTKAVAAQDMLPAAPGVGGGVTTNHEKDSAIMWNRYNSDVAGLGVHDARYVGMNDAATEGQGLNQATFEIMRDRSTPEEVLAAYEVAYAEFEKFLSQNEANRKAILTEVFNTGGKRLKGKGLGAVYDGQEVQRRVNELKSTVARVKNVKDGFLKMPNLKVDQYTVELGDTMVYTANKTDAKDITPTQATEVLRQTVSSNSLRSKKLGLTRTPQRPVQTPVQQPVQQIDEEDAPDDRTANEKLIDDAIEGAWAAWDSGPEGAKPPTLTDVARAVEQVVLS